MLRSWLYVREESGVTCQVPASPLPLVRCPINHSTLTIPPRGCALVATARRPVSFAAIRRCDKTGMLVVGPAQAGDYEVSRACGATSEDQRNCRSDGWQYGLVLQQLVCAFGYAMRRSSWMHVQGPSSAISHAPRTLQMSHVPNNDVCQAP